MKNISLLLNFILIVLVGWLYYKIYSGDCQPTATPAPAAGSGMPSNAIVFINSDTLLEKYNFFNELKSQLEKKQDSLDKVLRGQAAMLDREVNSYQERGAGMSADDRAKEEERLMQKQQHLMQMKQDLMESLQEHESQMNDSIHENLHRYLVEYNKHKNYYFILGYQRGSGILLANDSLDITKEILEGLNKK